MTRRILPYSARLQAGRGIVGAASATHQTIVSNNTAEDPRFVATLNTLPSEATLNTKAEIAIPLIVDNQVLGVLDVQSSIVGVFSEIEQTVLEALAAEVASAIYKAQQLAWQQGQAWITTAQLQVAEAISRSRDLDEILSAITRLTPIFVGVSRCCILLWDEELQIYKGAASSGSDSETEETVRKCLRANWGLARTGRSSCWPTISEYAANPAVVHGQCCRINRDGARTSVASSDRQ